MSEELEEKEKLSFLIKCCFVLQQYSKFSQEEVNLILYIFYLPCLKKKEKIFEVTWNSSQHFFPTNKMMILLSSILFSNFISKLNIERKKILKIFFRFLKLKGHSLQIIKCENFNELKCLFENISNVQITSEYLKNLYSYDPKNFKTILSKLKFFSHLLGFEEIGHLLVEFN